MSSEFKELIRKGDELLNRLDALPDSEAKSLAFGLLKALDAIHRRSLGRLIEELKQREGVAMIKQLAEDESVAALLEMYDLLPLDEKARAEKALETVLEYIHSHDGRLEVLGVEDGMVSLRLSGSCLTCPGSALTLNLMVESALREHMPGFKGMHIEDPSGQRTTIMARAQQAKWIPIAAADSVAPGTMRAFEVAGASVLLCNLGGKFYAYANACPGTDRPLHAGQLVQAIIFCPWHNCRFDVRTGARLMGMAGSGDLKALPISLEDGQIKLSVS